MITCPVQSKMQENERFNKQNEVFPRKERFYFLSLNHFAYSVPIVVLQPEAKGVSFIFVKSIYSFHSNIAEFSEMKKRGNQTGRKRAASGSMFHLGESRNASGRATHHARIRQLTS
ncbi:hypothetical protein DVH26_02710 [Paenibacillus sp. H1-7]|nr:hypothetical protein DVH26_02710 [Paenibacillus sp. H1-7]